MNLEVERISKEEVRENMKRMQNGKATRGLMNEENERERERGGGREKRNDLEKVNQEVERISKEEVWENTKRMKNGKAVCPDDIPVDVCK